MKNFFLSCKEIRIEPSTPKTYYGSFYLGPFPTGQGLTVANALRRTLLSDISGLAITSVKIEGVTHEYSTIQGVRETVLDILLNLKEIVVRKKIETQFTETQLGYLQVRGPGTVRAIDLKLPPGFQCMDPDQYIATLTENGSLNLVITIDEGKNFIFRKNEVSFSNIDKNAPIPTTNFLAIDAVFTPVKKVNYTIEPYGSESLQEANEIVILEVWTNGNVLPDEAVCQTLNYLRVLFTELGKLEIFKTVATKTLDKKIQVRKALNQLNTDFDILDYEFQENLPNNPETATKNVNFEPTFFSKTENQKITVEDWSSRSIQELGLPFRLFNSFWRANILTVNQLLDMTTKDLEESGFGPQSLIVLKENLNAKGLSLKNSI